MVATWWVACEGNGRQLGAVDEHPAPPGDRTPPRWGFHHPRGPGRPRTLPGPGDRTRGCLPTARTRAPSRLHPQFLEPRAVARDNTVKLRWRTLQLLPGSGRTSFAGTRVEVVECPDGDLSVQHQGETVASHEAPPRAEVLRAPFSELARNMNASPRASAGASAGAHPGGSLCSLPRLRRKAVRDSPTLRGSAESLGGYWISSDLLKYSATLPLISTLSLSSREKLSNSRLSAS